MRREKGEVEPADRSSDKQFTNALSWNCMSAYMTIDVLSSMLCIFMTIHSYRVSALAARFEKVLAFV